MEKERQYLYRAVEKTGVAVIVMRLMKMYNGKARIDYISENAEYFGMNMRSLREGYKLPLDYIHPDDREKLKQEVLFARESGIDYSCEVRFVGDSGAMRTLTLDVLFSEEDGGDSVMEFLIREPFNQRTPEPEPRVPEGTSDDESFDELFEELRIGELLREFAGIFDLYSAVMDMRGKLIGEAVGPTTYFGDFYEILHNPNNLEYFEKLKASIRSEGGSVYMEIDDGNPDNRFSAAPINVNGIYTATWLLYAHTKPQTQRLFYIHDKQDTIASIISDCFTLLSKENRKNDEIEANRKMLEFIRRERDILSELQGLSGDKKEIIQHLGPVGQMLDVDYIVYYSQDRKRPEKMILEDYWCRTGKSADAEAVFAWDNDHYSLEIQRKIRENGLVVDQRNMTNQMRVEVFNGNARAVMVFPVIQRDQYVGRLIFLENTKERVWSDEEIDFARIVTQEVSRKLKGPKQAKKAPDSAAFEVFDLVEYPIFARDNVSGEVIFSNRAMNLAIGGDFTKKNSFEIIPPAVDAFEGYSDAESASEREERQVTSRFRRYVSRLSGIYNVTEHRMKWKDKKPASLFILQEVEVKEGL